MVPACVVFGDCCFCHRKKRMRAGMRGNGACGSENKWLWCEDPPYELATAVTLTSLRSPVFSCPYLPHKLYHTISTSICCIRSNIRHRIIVINLDWERNFSATSATRRRILSVQSEWWGRNGREVSARYNSLARSHTPATDECKFTRAYVIVRSDWTVWVYNAPTIGIYIIPI